MYKTQKDILVTKPDCFHHFVHSLLGHVWYFIIAKLIARSTNLTKVWKSVSKFIEYNNLVMWPIKEISHSVVSNKAKTMLYHYLTSFNETSLKGWVGSEFGRVCLLLVHENHAWIVRRGWGSKNVKKLLILHVWFPISHPIW